MKTEIIWNDNQTFPKEKCECLIKLIDSRGYHRIHTAFYDKETDSFSSADGWWQMEKIKAWAESSHL